MSELSISRVERINRALLSRARQREVSQARKTDRILVMFGLSVAAVIMAAVLAINAEWQPGHQSEIAKRYRPLRHNALEVATK